MIECKDTSGRSHWCVVYDRPVCHCDACRMPRTREDTSVELQERLKRAEASCAAMKESIKKLPFGRGRMCECCKASDDETHRSDCWIWRLEQSASDAAGSSLLARLERTEQDERNYAESLDRIRQALGLAETHYLVLPDDVADVVARLKRAEELLRLCANSSVGPQPEISNFLREKSFHKKFAGETPHG